MDRGLLTLLPTRRGHFAYESGDHGDLWLDLDALVRRPAALVPHCAELAERLQPYRPEVVCGPLTGGAYVAQLVAVALDAEFCWTTGPGYGLARTAPAGRRAAVVDDAVNAGHATTATAASLTAAGATVVAVGALLTLTDTPPTVAGAPLLSLATLPATRWPAAACPRCAEGSPLDAPPA